MQGQPDPAESEPPQDQVVNFFFFPTIYLRE
jgi:hypothetical protein